MIFLIKKRMCDLSLCVLGRGFVSHSFVHRIKIVRSSCCL
ncbi:unnamed protein product [Amoebophrya sp. A25]|nr:unnamed protein product [Amoebophrya sp. A25]|eukprot:GSA25T00027269001.1